MLNKLGDPKLKENLSNVLKSGTLISLGIMMLLIAKSIQILGNISWDGLKRAGAGLLGFAGLVTLVFLASKLIGRKESVLTGFDKMLFKLGACVLLMAITTKILATVNWKGFLRAAAGFVIFGVFLVVLMEASQFLEGNEKGLDSFAKILGKLGFCVLLLTLSFKLLSTIKWDKFKIAVYGFVVFGGFITALMWATKLLQASENQLDSFAKILGKLGLCVLLLTLSFKLLSTIKWEKFGQAAAGMGVFAAFIAGIIGITRIVKDEKQVESVTKIIRKLGLCVLLMSISFKLLGTLDWNEFGRAAAGMAVFAGFIALVMLSSKLYGRKGTALTGFGAMLLKISACVLLMAVALKLLGTIKWDEFGRAVAGLGVLLAFIGVLMLCTKVINTAVDWKQMVATLGGIGVCMLALAACMKILGSMSWNEFGRAAAGMAVCSVFLLAVVGIMWLVKSMDKVIWQSLVTLAGLAVLLAGLAGILLLLQNIKAGKALVNALSLTILLGAMVGALAVMSSMNKFAWKALLTLAGLTLIMGSLGLCLWLLKDLNPSQSIGMAVALTTLAGALLVAFFAFAAIGSFASELLPYAMAGIAAIAAIVAETALVIAAFGALAQIPGLSWLIEEGGNFLQAVGTAIGQFVGGIVAGIALGATATLPKIGENLSGFMNNAKDFIEGAKDIDSSIVDSVSNLAKAMLAITGANLLDNLTSFFTGGKIKEWITGESEMEAYGRKLGELGGALATFSKSVDGKVNPTVVEAAANAALSLSKIKADSIIGLKEVDQAAVDGAAFAGKAIRAFCDEITTVEGPSCAEIIKALSESNLKELGKEIKSFSKNIGKLEDDTVDIATTAGNAIKSFCNSVVTIDGPSCAETIKALSESNLKELGKEIKSFSKSLGKFDGDATVNAVNAGVAISNLCTALPQTSEGINIDTINTLGKADLKKLGKHIKQFTEQTADITSDAATGATNACGVINSIFTNLPKTGSVNINTDGFNTNLTTLGVGIYDFVQLTCTITKEQVEAAVRAVGLISSVMLAIPNTGGILQSLVGENNFGSIANNLSSLGMAIRSYISWTGAISDAEFKSAEMAAGIIGTVMLAIPNTGGLIDKILGKNQFDGLAGNLTDIGKAIFSFVYWTGGITAASFASAEMAAGIIATVMLAIPNTGGLVDLYIGKNNFNNLIINMTRAGAAAAIFADKTKGITAAHFASAEMAAGIIATVMLGVPNNGGIIDKFFGQNNFSGIVTNLSELGEGIAIFVEKTKGITESELKSSMCAVGIISAITAAIPNSGGILQKIFGDNSFEGLENLGVSIKNFVNSVKDIDATHIDAFNTSMLKLASDAIDKFIKGFKDGIEPSKAAVSDLVAQSASAANNVEHYNSFFAAGEYVASGFCNGITSFNSLNKAYAAGKRLGTQAKLGAEYALREKSPSKVFYDIGAYAGEGLVIALNDYGSKSYDAGAEVAISAADGLTDAIKKVSNVVDSGMDNTLTITPVLDLSNVESGIKTLNGMQPSMGIMGKLNAVSASMNSYQNGASPDVVSAIEALGNKLSTNSTGDTYNINGITYDDGSAVAEAIQTIIQAARIERRV